MLYNDKATCTYLWGNSTPTVNFGEKTIPWSDIAGGNPETGIFLVLFYFATDTGYLIDALCIYYGFGRATIVGIGNGIARTFSIDGHGFNFQHAYIYYDNGPVQSDNYLIPVQIRRII